MLYCQLSFSHPNIGYRFLLCLSTVNCLFSGTNVPIAFTGSQNQHYAASWVKFRIIPCEEGATFISFEVINKILMQFGKNRTRCINIDFVQSKRELNLGKISSLVNILSKHTYWKICFHINLSSTIYYVLKCPSSCYCSK